jgi:hypothetical protein
VIQKTLDGDFDVASTLARNSASEVQAQANHREETKPSL